MYAYVRRYFYVHAMVYQYPGTKKIFLSAQGMRLY